MFCAPGLIFGGTEAIGFRFHVLPARIRFRQYRRRQVPFSCLPLPESFLAVTSASGPVFMFTAPGHVFGSNDGVGSCFHVFGGTEGVRPRFYVLRPRTHFRRYRGRRVPFSCFALPDSFSAVPRASGPVFMFCALEHVFGGNEGVGCLFHVLRSRTHFRRHRGRRVPFSSFVRPTSFSTAPRASGSVFMFCAPGLIFVGTEGAGSRFHLLRA
jgi:hypothetical protein